MQESGWHAVGPLEGIPDGVPQEREAGGEPILLVRRGATVHALAPLCPHKFGRLADGRLDGDRLTCPMHTATFDLATGLPLPGEEWAGRAQVHAVRVLDGIVEVRLAGA